MKIMAIVDRHVVATLGHTHAANHHEVRLVQLCFDFYMIEAKPENLIGDRAYDSDPLDEELRNDGIEMIASHRSNRSKPPTQDRRRLSRYTRRWLVERFFAWIQWQRRILVRWEYHAQNFSALSSSPASLSSSDDFEIGSSQKAPIPAQSPVATLGDVRAAVGNPTGRSVGKPAGVAQPALWPSTGSPALLGDAPESHPAGDAVDQRLKASQAERAAATGVSTKTFPRISGLDFLAAVKASGLHSAHRSARVPLIFSAAGPAAGAFDPTSPSSACPCSGPLRQ